MNRKILFLLCLILFIVSLGAVSATDDMNQTDADALSVSQYDDELGGMNYDYLQALIDTAENGSTINLKNDFDYVGSDKGITINKNITINGNGNTIDGSNGVGIFTIGANNVILNNINFINGNATYGGAIFADEGSNVTIMGCSFKYNSANYGGAIFSYGDLNITNSNFIQNTAIFNYGAIDTNGRHIAAENLNFEGNTPNNINKINPEIRINKKLFRENESLTINFRDNWGIIEDITGNLTVTINEDEKNFTLTSNYITLDLSDYDYGKYNLTVNYTGDKNYDSNFLSIQFWILNPADDSFTDLQEIIDFNANYVALELYHNYTYNESDSSCINISENEEIMGNGYVINANNMVRVFNILKGNTVVLNNINFINGNATYGGAIFADEGSDVDINSCIFSHNSAEEGGAVKLSDGNMANCTFTNNVAYHGGAIFADEGSDVDINSCIFSHNSAEEGGAVKLSDGNVANCTFTNNVAYQGGAVHFSYYKFLGGVENCIFINNSASNRGGAIYKNSGELKVNNSDFVNNYASEEGGAIFSDNNVDSNNSNFVNNSASKSGGAIFMGYGSVENCNFTDNNASCYGGAIYYASSGSINNCIFVNNSVFYPYNFNDDGGYDDYYDNEFGSGGAIYNEYGSYIEVTNSSFLNNSASKNGGAILIRSGSIYNCNLTSNVAEYGGAIYYESGTLEVINSSFVNNSASVDAGAFYCDAYDAFDKLTFADCIFINCSSKYGGAIFMHSGSVDNCTFVNNYASKSGGAIWFNSKGNVNNCNFIDNKAESDGGAIRLSGMGGNIVNCSFTRNIASDGGAIISTEKCNVDNCTFVNNSASVDGGAIDMDSGSVTNCTFINNNASRHGGAITGNNVINNCNFIHNTASDSGGSIYMFYGAGSLNNSNFTNNYASGRGGAIYFSGSIDNCNFVNNSDGDKDCAVYSAYGNLEVKNSNFTNNSEAIRFNMEGTVNNCIFVNNLETAIIGGSETLEVRNSNFINNSHAIAMGSGSVDNCTFVNNSASSGDGGAIRIDSGSVDNCTFVNNSASNYGGAIRFDDEGNVNNCVFVNNSVSSGSGGAIYFYDSDVNMDYYVPDISKRVVNNCTFVNNSASNYGGAVRFNAGGIVDNCTFVNNRASTYGGSVDFYLKGSVANSNFTNNVALNRGGAIRFYDEGTVGNCTFINNSASDSGGAVYFRYESKVTNSLFVNNSATSGGAITTYSWYGYDYTTSIILDNCNFTNNAAQEYGAVHIKLTFKSNVTNCNFVNNSVSSGDGGAIYISDSSNVTDCNFTNNTASGKGGALVLAADDCTLGNSNFIENIADSAGAVYWKGNDGILKYNNFNFYYSPGHNDYVIVGKNVSVIGYITVPDVTKYYGGDEQLIVTLTDGNKSLSNATVNVTIDGVTVSKLTDGNGQVFIDLNQPSGKYDVISSYKDFTSTSTVTIKPTISANDVEGYYNNVKYVVYLLDSAGNALTNGSTTFTINSKTYTATVSNGKATLNIGENHGSYVVSATNPSTGESISNNVTINQVSTGTTLFGVKDIVVGDSLSVIAIVNAVSGTVTFEVGSDSQKVDVVDGKATYTIDALPEGSYNISATYEDAEANYLGSSDIKSFKVSKANPKLNVVAQNIDAGQTAIFEITLDSDASGNVSVDIENKTYDSILSGGKATISVPGLAIGDYPFTVSYSGDDKYNASSFAGKIKVIDTNVVLIVQDLVKYFGVYDKLSATLLDSSNNPLVGKTVVFNISNVFYNRVTNGSGVASLNINLHSGVYHAIVTYQNISETAKITVLPAPTNTTLSLNKTGNNSVSLSASINSSRVGGSVMFNVSGKVYEGIVNKGLATVDVNNLIGGNYTVVAIYSGDENHDSSISNNVTFTIEKSSIYILAPDVTKYYGGSEKFVVNLTDDNNNPVSNATVNVTIDGATTSKVTDDNGQVFIDLNQASGEYNVISSYGDVSASSKVVIKPTISGDDVSGDYNNVSYVVNLLDSEGKALTGGTVTFTINSKNYTAEVSDAKATLNVGENHGSYVVSATNPSTGESISNNVTVNQVSTKTELSGVSDINVGDSLTVTAHVNATEGVVTFEINSDSANVTLSNNKANYTIEGLSAGNYTVTASYFDAKGNYLGSEDSKAFVVSKVAPTLDVVADDIGAGQDALFEITLDDDATGEVLVSINKETYKDNLSSGKAIIKVSNLTIGTYNYTVSYAGDDRYYNVSYSASIDVKDVNVVIIAPEVTKYFGGSERFYVTVEDKSGNPVANQSLVIRINGQNYTRTTGAEGKTSIAINLNPGDYRVVVESDDDSVVSYVHVKPTLNANDITMMYKNGTRYYVTVSQNGTPLANIPIKLNINGVFYDRVTKADGSASIAINLLPSEYIVTAERTDTGEKLATDLIVKSLLVDNKDTELFYRNGTGYTVKVIKQDGTVAGAGEIVTFNINGVLYERKTNDEGIARLNLNLGPSTYIITADYKGCLVSNQITVKPVLNASDLTKQYGVASPFAVTLVNGQGLPYTGQMITFNINGVFYNRTTNDEGIARLNINLIPGEYIITSMYEPISAVIANTVKVTL
ncbi:Ig-like domain repeat protein [Methanobrevibacter sp.]|uniref:Ig-like domain repeat protein n=1 Tax=Methanobrevibacter sp. TaxID=66852 RepID=UPI003890AF15